VREEGQPISVWVNSPDVGSGSEKRSRIGPPGVPDGLEAARARGRTGGRKPKLTTRQISVAQQTYDEKGTDGKRRYTVAEIAETFHVSRRTIYRHLEPRAERT
jgi:HTH domain